MKKYGAIVIGLGAMGSAAVYQLAKRGVSVLGIDQFFPPHTLGSTHGETRITRQAIGEGNEYVPLVLRSNEIWRELERETGRQIFTANGGLIVGDRNATQGSHGTANFLLGTIAAAETYNIPHEVLENDELRRRFPQFHFRGNETGYVEPGAGFLRPEECIEAQIELAKKFGAEIQVNEKMLEYTSTADGIVVRTDKGEYLGYKLILSVGPWIRESLPELKEYFKVYRQVLYWFKINGDVRQYTPECMPIYIFDFGNGEDFYGFPMVNGAEGGIKVALEDHEVDTSPQDVDRTVTAEETRRMFQQASEYLPELNEECLKAVSCLYTVTPDSKFVIDTHPKDKRIIIASPCSGHGFKHSAAIGEVLAELATIGKTSINIGSFSLTRFF